MKKSLLLIIAFVHTSFCLHAQNLGELFIDSLTTKIKFLPNDTNKVKALNSLCWELIMTGLQVKAEPYNKQALELSKILKFKRGEGKALNHFGIIYQSRSEFAKAFDYYHKGLKAYQSIGDIKGIAFSFQSIGAIYSTRNKIEEANKNYLIALRLYEKIGDELGVAYIYSNLANNYSKQGMYKKALQNLEFSTKIFKKLKSKSGIALEYKSIANILELTGNYKESILYNDESIKLSKITGRKILLIDAYLGNANNYFKLKNYKEVRKYLTLSQQYLPFYTNKMGYSKYYLANYKLDSVENKWKSAFINNQLYNLYKDSILVEENAKKNFEVELNYEFEKKEQAIIKDQEKKDAVSKSALNQEKLIKYILITSFLILLIVLILGYKTYLQKQQISKVIKQKNSEIVASIEYARRIQTTILPPLKQIRKHLPESFILYLPKDIVAGDFYWIDYKDNIKTVFFAACDCTGHGVPGAMVSVICHNALNKSLNEFGHYEPANILNKVRELVIDDFNKNSEEENQIQDGMDASICALNIETNLLQWSGANIPIWLIRKGELLLEIKANKQPVGNFESRKPYTNSEFQLKKGDCIYLATDGFADQFGGPRNKKFNKKRLKDLIYSIHNLPMADQQIHLYESIMEWRGDYEQIDDITIFGVRI